MMRRYRRFIEHLRVWVEHHAQGPYATSFLFFFGIAEAVFFPLPTETILVPLVLTRARNWLFYACVVAAGTTVGGVMGYVIGFFLYESLGAFLISLNGLAPEIAHVRELLTHHVFWTTFVAAFTPLPDKVVMPIAGFLRLPFVPFFIALALGRILRAVMVAWIVDRFGARAAALALHYLAEVTLVGVALALVLLGFWFFA